MIKILPAAAFVLSAAFGLCTSISLSAAAPAASPPGEGAASAPGKAPPAPPANASPPAPTGAGSQDGNKENIAPDDMSASRNAARSRMHECGHQWSTMKKSGAASGMTWKEFSQNCLARK